MITRFIKGFKKGVYPRIMGNMVARGFSLKGKNHNEKAMEYMLRGLENKRRIRNEKDLNDFSDSLFNGFISMKNGRFHSKNVFYTRDRSSVSMATEQYITDDQVYTVEEAYKRRLDRLGHEFGDIFKMLNDQVEAMIAKAKIDPKSIDNKSFFTMFGAISKLLKSINRFPNFMMKKKNLEQMYRLNDIVAGLMECRFDKAKSKKSGNLIISVLSNQFIVIHMCENFDQESELVQNNVEPGLTKKMREKSFELLKNAIASDIDIDMRGLLGVYQSKTQLGDQDVEFLRTIREYVSSNVDKQITNYPNGFDFGSLSLTYNKLANIRDPVFDEDVEKINEFIFGPFYSDFKGGAAKRLNIQFGNMTALFWGLTKYITENKDIKLRRKIKDFFSVFVENWDQMRITNFDFLSINKFIDSMVILNIFDDESSVQLQKLIYKNFSGRSVDRQTFTNYINLVTILLKSDTRLDGRSFENFVAKIEGGNSKMFPRTLHDFISSFETAKEIRRINKKGDNRTNDEDLVFNSFRRLIQIYHDYTIENAFRLNVVTMSKFYRIYIEFEGKRSQAFEKIFIQKGSYFGPAEFIMTSIEIDIIISEINEIQSQTLINELVEDYDFDEIFISDEKFESPGAFLQALSRFTTINYNLRRSQISRNLNNYPHLSKLLATQRKFVERFLEEYTADNIREMLPGTAEVQKFSSFLHEHFQAELKLGYENSQKICKGVLEASLNMTFEQIMIITKPICLSSSSLQEVLEYLQKILGELLYKHKNDKYTLNNITTILSLISLKAFFNKDLEVETARIVKDKLQNDRLTGLSFNVLLQTLNFLEESLICFSSDPEIVELVSQRMEQVAENEFKLLIAERRGNTKVNYLLKSVQRVCFFYKARDTTEEQKQRAENVLQNLEDIVQIFEDETGQKKVNAKDYLYSNLQNKTKEILQELNIQYQEEEYVGPFLVDFFLPEHNAVIEVTGPIHYVAKMDDLNLRTKFKIDNMKAQGYKVITLKNEELVESMSAKKKTLLDKLDN